MLLKILVLLPFAFGQTSDDIDKTADHIRAVNPLGNPYHSDTRLHLLSGEPRDNETFAGTLSLCSNGSNDELLNVTISSSIALRGYKSLVFYARAETFTILEFKDFLELPKFMGVHRIALPQTNRSVSELEEALAYAWAPSFEKSSMTPRRAQIVKLGQTWDFFSRNGSPLVSIVYILPLDELPSSGHCARPCTIPRNVSFHELPAVTPPSVETFWQRFEEKGFAQPSGNIFASAAPHGEFYTSLYLAENKSGYRPICLLRFWNAERGKTAARMASPM
ncbi:uncharacterized protein LOC129582326 isoform X1 [Paramacrobiotus metropolitanus]|uniref:uncharacterized protein LOC129582326 isoform X1 n=2 Tax=Paramacrobiotus metropolitanus TaxID=2943436 RepID=UPI00244629C3|nr:uncharacterized protein LOC129582326 isoform X1 [Paramacrobiotus metropolitanus]